MAHELTVRENGRVEMAFRAGTELPWHFGMTNPQQVPAGAGTADWIAAAGMEWTAVRAPLSYAVDGEMLPLHERTALYRSDTRAPLGVVGPGYRIVQPREVIEFFSDLTHTVGLELDTAGTMFGGRKFWALAMIGEQALIDNSDPHRGYLLLTTSADGSSATEARFTDVRVVCNNTLRMAMAGEAGGSVKVAHNTTWDADTVKRQLGVAPATFEDFMQSMRRLADHRLDDAAAVALVRGTLGKAEAAPGKEGKAFATTMSLFRGLAIGADLPGTAGTAYGLLNAYTETVDHMGRAKSDSHRLANALTGDGDRAKAAFRDQLLELVA